MLFVKNNTLSIYINNNPMRFWICNNTLCNTQCELYKNSLICSLFSHIH